jgi:tetratricopeptide (TPR) repeat protein
LIDSRSIDLGPEAEDAWLRLRHHLGWSQGFTLGFLFVATSRLADAFRGRLERAYRGRVSALQALKPASPAAALDEVMRLVRESPPLLDEMAAPLWIELQEHAGDEAWDRARTLVLARLNEHRELLRRRLGRPLIVILPQGWQAQARQIAPDLWFVRDFSLEVAAAITSIADEDLTVAKSPPVAAERSKNWWQRLLDKLPHPFRPRLPDHPLVAEWHRVRRKGGDDPNVLNVGWRATEFLLEQRRLEQAYAIANEVLALARRGSESDPRSLSVALNWMGDAAGALGRLEEAERAYAESLAVTRGLRQQMGETPEVLRDLSVSLNRVGDAAGALGRLEEAERAYAESLGVMRDLRQRLGDTPEVLRDLSVSLNRVGDAARALGRLEEAERAYAESLAVRRDLRQRLGDAPEVLRDLSVSLGRVGDAARALGRLEEAERAYAESLAVTRVLRQRLGDTPEVLRDLSVSLNRVGDAARALGRLEEARNAYREAATLLRRLDHVFPGQEYESWLLAVEAKYQATVSAPDQENGDNPP